MANKVGLIGTLAALAAVCVLIGCGGPAGVGKAGGGDVPLLGGDDDAGSPGGGLPADDDGGGDDDSSDNGSGTDTDPSGSGDGTDGSPGDDDPPATGDSDDSDGGSGGLPGGGGEGGGSSDDDDDDDDTISSDDSDFTLSSRLLLDGGGFIDLRFAWAACGGNNVSPQLSWTQEPGGTQSYVIVVFDEDAGDFIHWCVFDIAASVRQISEGGPAPGGQTLNDFAPGQFGYGGPCPPPGETHAYVFRIYALDVSNVGLTAGQATSLDALETLMAGRILDEVEFTARFAQP